MRKSESFIPASLQAPATKVPEVVSLKPTQDDDDDMNSDRVCLCGTSDCAGLSSAFRILGHGDARSFFHKIPHRKKKDSKARASVDAIRKAYVVALFPIQEQRPKLQPRRDYYIAKHHFHPALVENFTKLPYTLAPKVLQKYNISTDGLRKLGSVLSEPHPSKDSFIIIPNYPKSKARKDLQTLLEGDESRRMLQRQSSLPNLAHGLFEKRPSMDLVDQNEAAHSHHRSRSLSLSHRTKPLEPLKAISVSLHGDGSPVSSLSLARSRSLSVSGRTKPQQPQTPSKDVMWTDRSAVSSVTHGRSRSLSVSGRSHPQPPPKPASVTMQSEKEDESSVASSRKKVEVIEDTEEPESSSKRKGREWKKRIMARSLSRGTGPRDRDKPKKGVLRSIASELKKRRSKSPVKRSATATEIPFTAPASPESTDSEVVNSFDTVEDFPMIKLSTQSNSDEESSLEDGKPLLFLPGEWGEKTRNSDSPSDKSFSTWMTEEGESSDSHSDSRNTGLKSIIPSFGIPEKSQSSKDSRTQKIRSHSEGPRRRRRREAARKLQGLGKISSRGKKPAPAPLNSRRSEERSSDERPRRSLSPRRVLRSLSTTRSKRSESPRRSMHSLSVKKSRPKTASRTPSRSRSSVRAFFDPTAPPAYKDVRDETAPEEARGRDRNRSRSITRSLSRVVLRKVKSARQPIEREFTDSFNDDAAWDTSFDTGTSFFPKAEKKSKSEIVSFTRSKPSESPKAQLDEWAPQWDDLLFPMQNGSSHSRSGSSRKSTGDIDSFFDQGSMATKEPTRKSTSDIESVFQPKAELIKKPERKPSDGGLDFSEFDSLLSRDTREKPKRSRSLSRSRHGKRESSPVKLRARSSSRTMRTKSHGGQLEFSEFQSIEKKSSSNSFKENDANKSSFDTANNTKTNVSSENATKDPVSEKDSSGPTSTCVHTEVLETSQKQALLGNADEDSDFEEAWEKSNKAVSHRPQPASILATRAKKLSKKKHDSARRRKKHSREVNKQSDSKEESTQKPTSTSDDSDGGIGSIVEDLWDGVKEGSNGVDALADLLDDVEGLSIEIDHDKPSSDTSPPTTSDSDDSMPSPEVKKSGRRNLQGSSDNSDTERTEDSTLDRSQSTQDASNSTGGDSLTAGDTVASKDTSALSSPEEEEEVAYLELLKVEELERHDWFVHMQCVLESDFRAHRQVLATMKSEVEQVQHLMRYSYEAIKMYTEAVSELCDHPTFSEATGESGNDQMMRALVRAYKAITARFEEGLPALKTSVDDMVAYREELTKSILTIENEGLTLLEDLNRSEESVRKSWGKLGLVFVG